MEGSATDLILLGERQDTPWTCHQSIAGLSHFSFIQLFIYYFIPLR